MAEKLKTTNIKGKEYVEVNERVRAFRSQAENNGFAITTEMLHFSEDSVLFKANVIDASGRVVATGHAYEEKSSSMINKTSYVENCETSAVGRALGFDGYGIDTSIASAQELIVALAAQSNAENNAQGEKKVQPSNSTTQQATQPTTAQKEPSAQPVQKTASTKRIKVELAVDKENLTDEQKKFVKAMQAWVRSLPQEAINNLVSFTNKALADWTYMDYVAISQSNQK